MFRLISLCTRKLYTFNSSLILMLWFSRLHWRLPRRRKQGKRSKRHSKTSQQTYQYNGPDRSGSDIHISLCAMKQTAVKFRISRGSGPGSTNHMRWKLNKLNEFVLNWMMWKRGIFLWVKREIEYTYFETEGQLLCCRFLSK